MKTETVLVTGASSGIGLHLAHEFARNGYSLVIVAPVESELEAAAAEFRAKHGVGVRVVAKDLKQPGAAREIFDELESAGIEIDILCNNAGHGVQGKWWEHDIDDDLSMIRLNIEAVLRLTKLFLPPMIRRNRGRILNTASMVGFEPSPLLASYAATKAFILSWSEALAVELDETEIVVTALCPGVTDTDFFVKAGAENVRGRQSSNVMAPQDVAKAGYEGLMNKEIFVVPGGTNKMIIAARRILSEGAKARLNEKFNEEVSPDKQTHVRGEKENAASHQVE